MSTTFWQAFVPQTFMAMVVAAIRGKLSWRKGTAPGVAWSPSALPDLTLQADLEGATAKS
jgi:hypothetical protein